MPFKPCNVFIDGSELTGYTGLTLTRSKSQLTGTLNVDLFFGYVPTEPVVVNAAAGREISVYIGGNLAFIGNLDKRTGSGIRHGESGSQSSDGASVSTSIGPNEYTVKLTARGKTKGLIEGSHLHPTTNMMQPTNREALEKVIEGYGIDVDWMASEFDLDKVRFRDGARVLDELVRLGSENGHFIYETRDGKLRVTDDVGPTTGEPLILGKNILTFSAEQSEEKAKSEITVKGQRTKKDVWGEAAVIDRAKTIKDNWVKSNVPAIIQHYGDGTDEALERRAKFEADKRSSQSKKVKIDVFHIMPESSGAWDIGQLHYVEVPPEGIATMMECTDLTYTVQNDKTLKTTLTLSPPPRAGASGGLANASINPDDAIGTVIQQAADGTYPAPWSGPDISAVNVSSVINTAISALSVPLRLPKTFEANE